MQIYLVNSKDTRFHLIDIQQYLFLFFFFNSAHSNLIAEFSQTSLRHRYLDKGLPL